RDFLRRFASSAATARTTIGSATILIICAGSIESRKILPNRTRSFLGLRPSDRLVAGHSLLPTHVGLDQARIDRECFRTNQPGLDAHRNDALEYPAQGIAFAKALMACARKYRMIGDLVLDTELTKPPVRQIDLDLRAQSSLRSDRKRVADDQHPDHQHRINR